MTQRPIDDAPHFMLMRCECGRTRAEHMTDTLAEDHAFEPVDAWARRTTSGAAERGTKGRI